MENQTLETALCDLIETIKGITLGSVTSTVIDGAVKELINNWNDHNTEKINRIEERNNWENCKRDNGQYFLSRPATGRCPCGEDH